MLAMLRGPVAQQLGAIYPKFAERVFGIPIERAASTSL
jgi:hypothetical protein